MSERSGLLFLPFFLNIFPVFLSSLIFLSFSCPINPASTTLSSLPSSRYHHLAIFIFNSISITADLDSWLFHVFFCKIKNPNLSSNFFWRLGLLSLFLLWIISLLGNKTGSFVCIFITNRSKVSAPSQLIRRLCLSVFQASQEGLHSPITWRQWTSISPPCPPVDFSFFASLFLSFHPSFNWHHRQMAIVRSNFAIHVSIEFGINLKLIIEPLCDWYIGGFWC